MTGAELFSFWILFCKDLLLNNAFCFENLETILLIRLCFDNIINYYQTMFTSKSKNKNFSGFQSSKNEQKLSVVQKNTFTEAFNFKIGTKIYDDTDHTVAWQYQVPIILANEKSIVLKTQSFQVSLFSYVGNNFPERISIGCDNLSGYANDSGVLTTKIIVLELVSINNRSDSGIEARDLIYRSQTQNVWDLGSLRDLKFRIYTDDEDMPVELPTINDFGISFKILHVAL